MHVNKIVRGCVIQTFDTETKECIKQEFIPGDQVGVEDNDLNGVELSCPFLMTTPQEQQKAIIAIGLLSDAVDVLRATCNCGQCPACHLAKQIEEFLGK